MTETPAIEFAPFSPPTGGAAVVFAESGLHLSRTARELDEAAGGLITRASRVAQFKGKKKTHVDLLAPPNAGLDEIILMGLGKPAEYKEADWLNLGGAIRARLSASRAKTASVSLDAFADAAPVGPAEAANVALGLMLRSYEFKKYKQKKPRKGEEEEDADASRLKKITIFCADPEAAQASFERLHAVGEGVFLARDLINEPANALGPMEFAERIQELADYGVEVDILNPGRLAALKMNALLAVGQGSQRPSLVAVMRWRGPHGKKSRGGGSKAASKAAAAKPAQSRPLVFVGKGVCFDSGGISIKPGQGMDEMKGDMGGGACVAGLMLALAKRKAPVDVAGVVGLAENMPSGTAQRPGDIVTSMSGQTIEVLNTDAEGRLVLADAMWWAQEEFNPRFIVTLATLTGAIVVALGKEYAGLFSNDDHLAQQLAEAGQESDEKVWRLPMGPKYDKMIDSKIADMKNIGDRSAGSITAAQFLQRFVQGKTPWAHIDIAGTAMGSPATDISQGWTSGFGVRLLDRLISKYYES
jgi:leucyl aminopeptidase